MVSKARVRRKAERLLEKNKEKEERRRERVRAEREKVKGKTETKRWENWDKTRNEPEKKEKSDTSRTSFWGRLFRS